MDTLSIDARYGFDHSARVPHRDLNVPADEDAVFGDDSTPYLGFDVGEGWKLCYPERAGDGSVIKAAAPRLYVIGGPINNVD